MLMFVVRVFAKDTKCDYTIHVASLYLKHKLAICFLCVYSFMLIWVSFPFLPRIVLHWGRAYTIYRCICGWITLLSNYISFHILSWTILLNFISSLTFIASVYWNRCSVLTFMFVHWIQTLCSIILIFIMVFLTNNNEWLFSKYISQCISKDNVILIKNRNSTFFPL